MNCGVLFPNYAIYTAQAIFKLFCKSRSPSLCFFYFLIEGEEFKYYEKRV